MNPSRDPAQASASSTDSTPDVCTRLVVDDHVEQEWDALALAVRAAPFMRPGWVRAWMAAFSPGRPLEALTVRRNGELVALLPVLTGRRGTVLPANSETPVMAPVALDDRAVRALLPGLLHPGWRAELRFLPAGDVAQALMILARVRGLRVRCEVMRRSPYTSVDGDWQSFQQDNMSANRRRSLRKREQRLAAAGTVDFEVHDGRQNLVDLLTEGFGIELRGWKGAQGTAVQSQPPTEQFYWAVAEWAARAGLLRLYFLRLDGRPVAFAYRLEQHGVIHGIKIAYDEEFREYGPGILLMKHMLADAFHRGEIRSFEWHGEADPHKLEFATGVHEQLTLQLFSRSAIGVVEHGVATAISTARAEARRRLAPKTRWRIRASLNQVREAVPRRAAAQFDRGW